MADICLARQKLEARRVKHCCVRTHRPHYGHVRPVWSLKGFIERGGHAPEGMVKAWKVVVSAGADSGAACGVGI